MIDSLSENKFEENSLVSKSHKLLSSSLNIQEDELPLCLNRSEEINPFVNNESNEAFGQQKKKIEFISKILKPDFKRRSYLALTKQHDNKNKHKINKTLKKCHLNKVTTDYLIHETTNVPGKKPIYKSINIGK